MTDNKLTHFDASGNAVMVDVSPNNASLFPPLAAVVVVAPIEGRLWQSPQSKRFRQRLPY